MKAPTQTPWGPAYDAKEIFPGCWSIDTMSHGGFYVGNELLAQMPACLSRDTWAGPGWFEEDCDWALVVCAFPQHFSPYQRFCAVRSLQGRTDKSAWREFSVTPAGRKLFVEVAEWHQANLHRYEKGSMSSEGLGWHVFAHRIDGLQRLCFQCVDPFELVNPFTLSELEAAAVPGTLRTL